MTRRGPSARQPRSPRGVPEPVPAPFVPLSHPAWMAALAVAIVCVLLSVTFEVYEKDFWQHLAVGRAIWHEHRVPTTQLWTWPTYGAPDVNSSWGFRALLWPLWQAGGVGGLFAWRWFTTLVVFGLGFVTARRMGARGFTPLVVIALCALTYRQRSQVRPETLASVWLALSILLLESRRHAAAGRDRVWLMAPILWAWINTHISYPLGLVVLGVYSIGGRSRASAGAVAVPSAVTPWLAAFAGVALGLMNPFGVAALTQPFEYFFGQRSDPILRIVPELWPLDLRVNLTNLLPLVVFGWPALMLWRAWRRRIDWVELLLGGVFLFLAFSSQRFLGFTMVVATPFLARDLEEWVRARCWPSWTAPAWARAGLAMVTSLSLGIVEWRRTDLRLGVGVRDSEYPVAACDFMAREGVGGRGFNPFYYGGYMLYRFWPDRSRLPFMDIHQTGTREDRDTYSRTLVDPAAWSELDARHQFDYVLLRRQPYAGDRLLEVVDADPAFALVFMDDAAALYVRRNGPLKALAARWAYRELPAGTAGLGALGGAALADSARGARVRAELIREASGSRWNSLALGMLGSLELALGDRAAARAHLSGALRANPRAPRAHERLGVVALAEGRPADARRELETERRLNGLLPAAEFQMARAWQALGDLDRARRHYGYAVARDPGNTAARDSLARLTGP